MLCMLLLAGCGAELSQRDQALLERQKFSVDLVSWAPLADGRLALDLTVNLRGKSDLRLLTLQVRQVGAGEDELQVDLVPVAVDGMGFDGRKSLTVTVAAAQGVQAVAIVLENVPDAGRRSEYPELAG
jgi:hypothetical protein